MIGQERHEVERKIAAILKVLNDSTEPLPAEHRNKPVEQGEREDIDVKGKSIVSPRIGGI